MEEIAEDIENSVKDLEDALKELEVDIKIKNNQQLIHILMIPNHSVTY